MSKLLTRRNFLLTAGAAAASRIPAQTAERPWNVVFILIDDMGWTDLSCYGSTFYRTPNIDRLAKEGMRFTNAYAACPVCSPTRASILTGKYPARLHITDWIPGLVPPGMAMREPEWTKQLPLEETTIAEALKARSYRTGAIGKWHLGGRDYYPEKQGFDKNVGGTSEPQPPKYFAPYNIETLPEGPAGEYLTDRLATESLRFLDETGKQPFFLYLAHFAVHMPIQAKKDLTEAYEDRIRPGQSQSHPVYAAMVQSVDESVGALLRHLEQSGVADRTVVIFTSDNGGVIKPQHITSMEPLRGEKGTLWEGGIRVPLIVKWPGIARPGSVCDVPVSSPDYFPTIAEIAGARLPEGGLDGTSIVPLLRGSRSLKRDTLYWHYPHYNLHQALVPLRPSGAIRKGDFKLIEQYEDGSLELYNLRSDIGERFNLAYSHPQKAEELRNDLHAWLRSVGAQMPTPAPENYDPRKTEEWKKARARRQAEAARTQR
jgi:arylsulfatase A-like enzyme